MLTSPELLVRARDWSEVLFDVVPIHALEPAVRKAFADHDSSFPLNAYELKTAYHGIKDEIRITEDARTLTTDERVDRCSNRANHLPNAFGTIAFYIPDRDQEYFIPCGICRKEDFMEAKTKLLKED